MQDLVQADFFFFVSTIAVAVLAIGSAVVIFYVVVILKEVRRITFNLREVSRNLRHQRGLRLVRSILRLFYYRH